MYEFSLKFFEFPLKSTPFYYMWKAKYIVLGWETLRRASVLELVKGIVYFYFNLPLHLIIGSQVNDI